MWAQATPPPCQRIFTARRQILEREAEEFRRPLDPADLYYLERAQIDTKEGAKGQKTIKQVSAT